MGARLNAENRRHAEKHLAEHVDLRLSPQELDNLTRGIGSSIIGFGDFDAEETTYGRPGTIVAYGELTNGRRYEVVLEIVEGYRVYRDEF